MSDKDKFKKALELLDSVLSIDPSIKDENGEWCFYCGSPLPINHDKCLWMDIYKFLEDIELSEKER